MSFATDHPYVLTASCPSRMGTTAAITGFLAARRFYLMEMHQFDDTISQRFFVRITFCAVQGETVDLARLREEFAAVARGARRWNGASTTAASACACSSWCRTSITASRICCTGTAPAS